MRFKGKFDWVSLIVFLNLFVILIIRSGNPWDWGSTLMLFLLLIQLVLLLFFSYNGDYVIEDDVLIIQKTFRRREIPYNKIVFINTKWYMKKLHISLDMGKGHPYAINPKDAEGFLEELKKHLKEAQYAL